MALIAAPVRAGDFWTGMIAGVTLSALIMENQEPGWQRQQRMENDAVGSNAQRIVVIPQNGYDYSRITPREEPRTQYLRDCQRYGFTLNKCRLMWDGPEIEEEVSVAKKQQNRY
jgi:hypothetical protein